MSQRLELQNMCVELLIRYLAGLGFDWRPKNHDRALVKVKTKGVVGIMLQDMAEFIVEHDWREEFASYPESKMDELLRNFRSLSALVIQESSFSSWELVHFLSATRIQMAVDVRLNPANERIMSEIIADLIFELDKLEEFVKDCGGWDTVVVFHTALSSVADMKNELSSFWEKYGAMARDLK